MLSLHIYPKEPAENTSILKTLEGMNGVNMMYLDKHAMPGRNSISTGI